MPTYIILSNWTQQGIQNIKASPARLDDAKKVFQSLGATLKDFYMVEGQYDLIIVAEAPNDDTVAKLALMLGSRGNVRTQTLRAFTEVGARHAVPLPSPQARQRRQPLLDTETESLRRPAWSTQPATAGLRRGSVFHSTVTLLAKFLGWSMSVPRRSAI